MRDAQNRIAQTLFELLKEQDISEIGIGELCERAQIARTTFYYYYRSMDEALANLLLRMLGHLNQTELSGPGFYEEYLRVLKWIKENATICMNFRSGIQMLTIDASLHRYLDERIARMVEEISGGREVEEHIKKRICESAVHILIAETISWIDSGMPESPEEHLRLMMIIYDGFIEHVLHNFRKYSGEE